MFIPEEAGIKWSGVTVTTGLSDCQIYRFSVTIGFPFFPQYNVLSYLINYILRMYFLGNPSKIEHLFANDTVNGISISGAITSLRHVTSEFSSSDGIHLEIERNDIRAVALSTAYNQGDGISISSIDVTEDNEENASDKRTLYLDTCSVHSNGGSGLRISAFAAVRVRHCTISNNELDGVSTDQTDGGSIRVESSLLHENGRSAMSLNSDGIYVDSCTIRDHNYGYFDSSGTTWMSAPLIHLNANRNIDRQLNIDVKNSNIVNNSADGIFLNLNHYSRESVRFNFTNNTVANCNRTLTIYTWYNYYRQLSLNMSANRFQNNVQTTEGFINIDTSRNDVINFEDNLFQNNDVNDLILIAAGRRTSYYQSEINLRNNHFASNTARKTLIFTTRHYPMTIRSNVFEDNSAACYVEAPTFDVTYEIEASRNYWGTTDVGDVIDKLCGFEKTMDRSVIKYLPFYSDRTLTTLAPYLANDVNIQGFIGGEITRDVVFSFRDFGSPITIMRSVMIR